MTRSGAYNAVKHLQNFMMPATHLGSVQVKEQIIWISFFQNSVACVISLSVGLCETGVMYSSQDVPEMKDIAHTKHKQGNCS